MVKYMFSVQFSLELDFTSEGDSTKEVAEKLEKKLKSRLYSIWDAYVTFLDWSRQV